MVNEQKKWSIYNFIRAFFPFQLLISHIKHNLISLFFWVVLFLIVSGSLGFAFGIPQLFLSPEYLGEVSVYSFFFIGFTLGAFIMGFHTYAYMKLGPHYAFLTTLSKPFLKFCINNSIIPIAFIIYYNIRIVKFLYNEELSSPFEITTFSLSFLIGITVFIAISFLYFFRVGIKNTTDETNNPSEEESEKPMISVMHKRERWFDRFKKDENRISIYIGKSLKLKHSRSLRHFNQKLVEKVFAKNRINASIFEIATIGTFFLLGAFNESKAMNVPASVSILLLLTIIHMLFSALHSWFKGWIYTLLIIVLFGMNYLSQHSNLFNYTNFAYGLNYSIKKKDSYTIQNLKSIYNNDSLTNESHRSYIKTLEQWKKQTGKQKPKLVILSNSGGGSRSALWTVTVLQNCDKELNNELSKHIHLITGASGGMVGAAYYRELLLREKKGEIQSKLSPIYRDNIGKDMLNRLAFMASTNDMFIRYQKFMYNDNNYTKDRGFAFEEQLNENTNSFLDHPLSYYAQYEKDGTIPTMIFSPTIINDGRRLLISSQPLNFLTSGSHKKIHQSSAYENIDYHSLLKNQSTGEIRFTSVLRMNATFPFVMPMVTLPTTPEIQIMDAGIRDNYGGKTMSEFVYAMKDWIKENTDGIVIVQIRDTRNILKNESYSQISFLDKITLPFGNMYKNFPRVHDFNQEAIIKIGIESMDFPVDIISFNLREKLEDKISLSWHLTSQEKKKIENAVNTESNRTALEKLKKLIQ